MKAIFGGRTRPYPRKNGGGMAYGVIVILPDPQEAGCVQDPLRCGTNAALDARLAGLEIGTELDLDIQPRMFMGKPQGFDVIGING